VLGVLVNVDLVTVRC